jgi:UDP-glucose 4-epimerase
MKCFVTGGAGFIGSHLVDKLLAAGNQVVVFDNLSLGRKEFINHHFSNSNFKFIKGDLLNFEKVKKSMAGSDVVFHLAANSDIIQSAKYTKIDLNQGTIATYNVLEAMRANNVKKIVFTSSNVVYGEAKKLPIKEDYGPLFPISLYGASKLACEGLITAFCHNFKMQSWIYRFANIMGDRSTHGVVIDFFRKLNRNTRELEVLGNGKQSKPYVDVLDCVAGILYGFQNSNEEVNVFNLGTKGMTTVKKIADEVIKQLNLEETKIRFTGGDRGWPGDVRKVSLDSSKLLKLGWKPKYPTSDQAAMAGIKALIQDLKRNKYNRKF